MRIFGREPALIIGAALVAEYGYQVSDHVIAALSGAVLAGFALFGVRPQVSPVPDVAPMRSYE